MLTAREVSGRPATNRQPAVTIIAAGVRNFIIIVSPVWCCRCLSTCIIARCPLQVQLFYEIFNDFPERTYSGVLPSPIPHSPFRIAVVSCLRGQDNGPRDARGRRPHGA